MPDSESSFIQSRRSFRVVVHSESSFIQSRLFLKSSLIQSRHLKSRPCFFQSRLLRHHLFLILFIQVHRDIDHFVRRGRLHRFRALTEESLDQPRSRSFHHVVESFNRKETKFEYSRESALHARLGGKDEGNDRSGPYDQEEASSRTG